MTSTFLARLRSLSFLYIWNEEEIDVSFLHDLGNIETLTLRKCKFRDTSPISSLKELTMLDLSDTTAQSIDEFSELQNMRVLNLRSTKIDSIASISGLKKITSLDISRTAVKDLLPLANMKSLYYANLDDIKATTIPPLKEFSLLRTLSCAGTPLTNLDFVSDVISLENLDISRTRIEDLRPLEPLHNLVLLSAVGTPIKSLEPVAGLYKLRRLDISNTQVTDLSPISGLTVLARGPRGGRTGGLFFSGSPIVDKTIRSMNSLRKADRAEKVIDYLRIKQGLPSLWDTNEEDRGFPTIPPQEGGPHFTISDSGSIEFEPPMQLDANGNNISRLRAFHPRVVQMAKDLVSLLSPNEQSHLLRAVKNYLKEASKSLKDVNFDILYGEGLFLEEAAEAAKREAGARIAPPLEDAPLASLNSLIHLHGVFILSSKSGIENIELAERYESKPEIDALRKETLAELVNALGVDDEVASYDVISYIADIPTQSEVVTVVKQQSFKSSAVKNLLVVLTAGASIAALPWTGAILSGPTGGNYVSCKHAQPKVEHSTVGMASQGAHG